MQQRAHVVAEVGRPARGVGGEQVDPAVRLPAPEDLETVDAFDLVSEGVTVEKVRTVVDVSSDLGWHRDRLASYAAIGFDEIYLHHVGRSQERFIDTFGEHVLPQLKEST